MNRFRFATPGAVALLAASAGAETLSPNAARSFDLTDQTAVVYFTPTAEGCRVVTTLGPNHGYESAAVRFVTTLPTQGSTSLSLGGAIDDVVSPSVSLRCANDTITAELVPVREVAALR